MVRLASCEVFCGNLRTGTPKKFADLRLRNEPKNLRICDLRTSEIELTSPISEPEMFPPSQAPPAVPVPNFPVPASHRVTCMCKIGLNDVLHFHVM